MSLLSNAMAIPSAASDFTISSSLRYRQAIGSHLSRTLSTSSNRKTWTWSAWYKLGSNLANVDAMFSARSGNEQFNIYCGYYIRVRAENSGGTVIGDLTTSARYRDPSAWYHYVVVLDATNATTADRCRVYINGERQSVTLSTSFSNTDFAINNSSLSHTIGKEATQTDYIDGYLTEVNFVDGQALDPTAFGEYDDTTGVWKPKRYSGSYGTNGFYLENGRGTDQSGNGNNWTENYFNTTSSSLTTYDIMSDVPTLTDEDTANYPTLNPISQDNNNSTSKSGNLELYGFTASWGAVGTTMEIPSSGKWYWEVTQGTSTTSWFGGHYGIYELEGSHHIHNGFNRYIGTSNTYGKSYAYGALNGKKYTNGASATYAVASTAVNDVIGISFDADTGTLTFYKNNVSLGAAFTGITGRYMPAFAVNGDSGGTYTYYVNFGQRPFKYTPPTGHKKLNSFNLPDSAIVDGSQYMNPVTYTGNGSTNAITGVGFSPDFVWLKSRSLNAIHAVFDTVRGGTKRLRTNDTVAEDTSTALTTFDADGFTLGNDYSANNSGSTFVAWNWRGSDSTAVSNTDGGITSTVSANTTSGFSVCTYTGNGATTSFGHGLGVAPDMVIAKSRDSTYAYPQWYVYHRSLGASNVIMLNLTDDPIPTSAYWGTNPDSSKVYIGPDIYGPNVSGDDYVAYCFAPVDGFSKFGAFTGNGDTDGPFIYTGFRPAWIMFRCYSNPSHWTIVDTARGVTNVIEKSLYSDTSTAELTTITDVDALSNGFKFRGVLANETNVNGYTYIYAAFAENPFKNSLAR